MNSDKLWEKIKATVKAMEAVTNPPPKPFKEIRKGNVIRRRPSKV